MSLHRHQPFLKQMMKVLRDFSQVQVMSVTLEQCNKCKMVEQLDRCNEQTSPKLAVQKDEVKKTTLPAILQEICQGGVKLAQKN